MEFFGLENFDRLDHRIIYDFYTRENIEKQYAEFKISPIYLERLLFIEPGVDVPLELDKKFSDPLKIICAGRGGSQKRIWLVNEIAEYFINQNLPVDFHFAGTLIVELSEHVKKHSTLHGEISDPAMMKTILFESNIALLTSIYEGFPMFIKESMAQGCIPIATALPGNLMHLKDRSNSLLVHEILDEKEIVRQAIEIIKELLANKNLAIRISGEAYTYAKNHFSRAEFNKKYQSLLSSPH